MGTRSDDDTLTLIKAEAKLAAQAESKELVETIRQTSDSIKLELRDNYVSEKFLVQELANSSLQLLSKLNDHTEKRFQDHLTKFHRTTWPPKKQDPTVVTKLPLKYLITIITSLIALLGTAIAALARSL
jgi:hypothetical protein